MAHDGENLKSSSVETGKVRAWDLPTRLFHWTLVLLIVNAYVTRHCGDAKTFWYSKDLAYYCADDELFWHKVNGYAVLTLIAFRLSWGFVGGATARFYSFVSWPWTAARYGYDLFKGRPRDFLGHNPAGGWVVFLMLGMIAFQGISGLFAYDDVLAEGPLFNLVTEQRAAQLTRLHLWNFELILVVIIVHILASILYYVIKRDNLVGPMLTGRKKIKPFEDRHEARFGSPLLALFYLALSAGVVLGGIKLAGGILF